MAERLVCGGGIHGIGCGIELRFERNPSVVEWKPSLDTTVAIRCLDCGVLLCPRCARYHFEGDEKDREIRDLNAQIVELKRHLRNLAEDTSV